MRRHLKGQSVLVPKQPLEILRTIHSFDPCLARAVHVVDPNGEELIQVRLQSFAPCRRLKSAAPRSRLMRA
jgi:Ni,Fe-hydrogenase I large subunit